MSALTEFLFPAPADRTARAIVGWWEKRRLAYNLWVGAAGLVSLGSLVAYSTLSGFGLAIEPFIASAVFGVLANGCYLLGPVTEIAIQKIWGRQILPTGPVLFRMGLTFSVGLALFPTLILTILTVVRVVAAVAGIG